MESNKKTKNQKRVQMPVNATSGPETVGDRLGRIWEWVRWELSHSDFDHVVELFGDSEPEGNLRLAVVLDYFIMDFTTAEMRKLRSTSIDDVFDFLPDIFRALNTETIFHIIAVETLAREITEREEAEELLEHEDIKEQ